LNPIFDATVKNGKVIFHNLELLNGYLISLEKKEVEVVIRKKKKHRTNPQNAYYWACVVGNPNEKGSPAEHFGYTAEELHEAYKFMFLRKHAEGKPDTVRSTKDVSTVEFSAYVEQCRQFCAEEGIYIPDPNEVDLEPDKPIHEPSQKEIKEHQAKHSKEAQEYNEKPVEQKFLEELFGWAGKSNMTEARIIELSMEHFGKEPQELKQTEAERLESLIITELPMKG